MARRLLTVAALACLLGAPAVAQQPPAAAPVATGRCGGLLCDAYYAGKPLPAPGQPDVPSPTSLPCRDFLCAAFGGRTPETAPPVAEQAAPEPVVKPAKSAGHKRKPRKVVASADSAGSKGDAARGGAARSDAAKSEAGK